MQTDFVIETRGAGSYEFTAQVQNWLIGQGDGVLSLMIRHTSASLLIMENADPEVHHDLKAYFDRLVPRSDHPSMSYLTHTYEGADDMPAHLKAALMPVSLSIPVRNGVARLGTWQGIYVVEHRDRPHRREVAAHFRSD